MAQQCSTTQDKLKINRIRKIYFVAQPSVRKTGYI